MKNHTDSRIEISYDINTNNTTEKKSLPFVVGIVGDYLGNNSPNKDIPVVDREFIEINENNFNDTMKALQPGVKLTVDNHLSRNEKSLDISLSFKSMEDFTPTAIINQVPELKALYLLRQELRQAQQQNNIDELLIAKLEEML